MRPFGLTKSLRNFVSLTALVASLLLAPCSLGALAQTSGSPSAHVSDAPLDLRAINRAMGALCAARATDNLGSTPIDEMQARPSLPVGHAQAVMGRERAARLLPLAKELTAQAVREIAREYGVPPVLQSTLLARMGRVQRVRAEMELRDNAAVIPSEPHSIHFGTIFLASLRSDEAMLSVLAHELTHIADGSEESLRPLFARVAQRAMQSPIGINNISRARAEELVCDLVGVRVVRAYIERTPNAEYLARRMARSVQHNCVARDSTDEAHLSPRDTMRALLALDSFLAHAVTDGTTGARSNGLRRAATQDD